MYRYVRQCYIITSAVDEHSLISVSLHRQTPVLLTKGNYSAKPLTDTEDGGGGALRRATALGGHTTTNEFEWTRIRNSEYDGTCKGCGQHYSKGDAIFVINREYFSHINCLEERYPNAYEKGKGIDKRAGASTGNGTSDGATNASRARWELVTADDGVIVLRKVNG